VNRVFFVAPSVGRGRHSLRLQLVRKSAGRSLRRAFELAIQIQTDIAFVDRVQEIRDGFEMELSQGGERIQQPGGWTTQVGQVLIAVGKRDPIVARETDACLRGCRLPVVVQRKIRGAGDAH